MSGVRPVRLTFLVNCFDLSGVETIIARTIAGLDRERYDVRVVALQQRGGRFRAVLEDMHVPCVDVGMRSKADVAALARLVPHLRGVDVLHTATFHSHVVGRLLGRLLGIPLILGAEVLMDYEPWPRLWLNRLTAGIPAALICNSEAVRQYVIETYRVDPARALTVYQGVDVDRYPRRRPTGETPVAGTVGRLSDQKGYPLLVAAASRLHRSDPTLRWVCVGEGPERARIEADIRSRGLDDVVSLAGYRADMPTTLGGFDYYVQASIAEGLSYALLEAMAAGLPVVATDVGGTRELVEHGVTGLLVPSGDATALAEAVAALRADPARAAAMGERARQRVAERFSEAGMARAEDQVIRTYLA